MDGGNLADQVAMAVTTAPLENGFFTEEDAERKCPWPFLTGRGGFRPSTQGRIWEGSFLALSKATLAIVLDLKYQVTCPSAPLETQKNQSVT